MRVKLSYTVDEEDVLREAAKLIGLCGEDLQHGVTLFGDVQKELAGKEEDKDYVANTTMVLDMLEEFREALANVDIRLSEVAEIIKGYDDYARLSRDARQNAAASGGPPLPVLEEASGNKE